MRKLGTLVLAVVLGLAGGAQAAEKESKASKAFKIAGYMVHATSAIDLVSTELCLSQGWREGNPLMQKRAIRIPLKLALPFVVNHVTGGMRDRKAAFAIRIAASVGFALIATRNFKISFSVPMGG